MSRSQLGATDIFLHDDDTIHPAGTARTGFDRDTAVAKSSGLVWNLCDMWTRDGSVFPVTAGVTAQLRIARRPSQDHRTSYRQHGACAFRLHTDAFRVGTVENCAVRQPMNASALADEFGG